MIAKYLLIALLLSTVSCALQTSSTETIKNELYKTDYRVRVPLPNLVQNDVLDFQFNFPAPAINPTTPPTPVSFRVRIITSSNVLLSPQPTGFDTPTNIPSPGSPITLTWTSGAAGDYWVEVYTASGDPVESVAMFELLITKSPNIEVARRVDIIRFAPMKYLYSNETTTLTITHSSLTTAGSSLQLRSIDNLFDGAGVVSTTPSGTTAAYSVTKGFYLARFISAPNTQITYQGAPYTCPFHPTYLDTANTFPFCVHIPIRTDSLFPGSAPLYTSTYPIFDLGNRNLREVVRIELTFRGLTTSAPTAFKLVLKDTSYGNVVPQPLPFNTDITIPNGGFYQTIFTVPVAGHYYLEVEMVGAMEALEIYNIIGSLTDGTILFNSVDVLRQRTKLLKYIKLDTPGLIRATNSRGEALIDLFAIADPTTSLDIGTTPIDADTTITNQKSYYSVGPGYYVAVFGTTAAGDQADISIQSNSYTCVFGTAATTDPRGIFQGCTGTPAYGATVPSATVPPTYGDSLLQLADDSDALARHNLGTLQANDRIYFTFDFLRPTEDTPSVFMPQILDNTRTPLAPQPTGFGMTYSIPLAVQHQVTIDWNVTATGDYYLDVVRPGTDDANSFVIYELRVFKSTGAEVLKEVDIVRNPTTTDFLYNLIYLSTTSTIRLWNTLGVDNNVLLFPMKSTNFLQTDVPAAISPISTGPVDSTVTLKQYGVYPGLAPGWYGVRFVSTVGGDTGSASFQSYPYQCPYTAGYVDIRADFNPCLGTMPLPGAKTNLHQTYVMQAHGCGQHQFYNGTCNNVDPAKKCNTFNALSGQCTTCPNSRFNLSAGWCVVPPSCPAGSATVGLVCVSDLCKTSTSDGKCASCKSVLNEVKSDGSCGLKVCQQSVLNTTTGVCESPSSQCESGYFYVAERKECYLLSPHCLELNQWLICSKCQGNYTSYYGGCAPCRGPNPNFPCRTCPDRFYLNSEGVCTRVDNQCDEYSLETGLCTSCKTKVLPVDGVCCPPGQTAQGTACVSVGGTQASQNLQGAVDVSFLESVFFKHCAIVDTQKQICNRCKPGRNFVTGTNLCA